MSKERLIPLFDTRNQQDMCIGHLTIKDTDEAGLAWLMARGHRLELAGTIEITPTREYKLKEIRFVTMKAENKNAN